MRSGSCKDTSVERMANLEKSFIKSRDTNILKMFVKLFLVIRANDCYSGIWHLIGIGELTTQLN